MAVMHAKDRQHITWVAAVAAAVALLGSGWLLHAEWTRLRAAFDTQARIVHRLLSQQMVQHEAVLATLALLPPAADMAVPLTAVYPHIRHVEVSALEPAPAPHPAPRSDPDTDVPPANQPPGPPPTSHQTQPPTLTTTAWSSGRYTLKAIGAHASVKMDIDLTQWAHPPEWPDTLPDMPLAVDLVHAQALFVLQPQTRPEWEWQLEASKAIASHAQPFTVRTRTHLTWAHIPWAHLAAWWLAVVAVAAAALTWHRQRQERQRAQALLKLDQVSRLGTLAEVGAGVAHEINQPLTAILANAQAASRALKDSPPDIALLRQALDQTIDQAKRAAGVVTRLRRLLERPGERHPMRRVALGHVATHVLDLLSPTAERLGVSPRLHADAPVHVMADPVALEQIVHNLVQNALASLERVPATERHLVLTLAQTPRHGVLTVTDTGAGIAPDLLPRLFEPFVTTRPDGLGLGLTLCETLASHMNGHLRADHHPPRGAVFELSLPIARKQANQ